MTMDKKRTLKKIIILSAALILPIILPTVILLAGYGSWKTYYELTLIFSALWCIIGIIVSLILLLFKKRRTYALEYIVAFVIAGMMIIPTLMLSAKIRIYAFYLAGLRAEKLIGAVEKYITENNKPPENLDVLVPVYLEFLPTRLPPLKINTNKNPPHNWSLSATVNTGLINWDEFIYQSDQDYSVYGPAAEKLGKWIYYHE